MGKTGVFGVLCLQGGYANHVAMLRTLGHEAREVRYPEELDGLRGIVLPGGESTTIGMLLERHGLFAPLRDAILGGLPAFGTCAGAIMLASEILGSDQPRFGAIDLTVDRNAYGSQVDSFEAKIEFRVPAAGIDAVVDGVFIRAPKFTRVGKEVETFAEYGGQPVLVRGKNVLACSFHPELTADTTIHRFFCEMALS